MNINVKSHCYDLEPWLYDQAVFTADGDASGVHIPSDFTKVSYGKCQGFGSEEGNATEDYDEERRTEGGGEEQEGEA